MSFELFFYRDPRDPYAVYDFYGDRYWTGANYAYERLLLVEKLLEYR